MDALDYLSTIRNEQLNFIDMFWIPYSQLKRHDNIKRKQISSLYHTGLCESGEGVEYCFIPTTRMQDLESEIKELYSKLKVEDNEVSLCNEVFYTTKIEGANTTLVRAQQIHNGEYLDMNNYKSELMVLNGFKASKYLNLKYGDLNEKDLLELWSIIVDGVCENEDIRGDRYRIGSVQVGKHVGLNHILLDETMSNWINYYNSLELSEYPFIKASLLHFAFEFIHPFCDGNGRCGRFLMSNYLIKSGWEKLKAVSFSRSIEKNIIKYYNAFEDSDNVYTDCTPFIEFMLEVILDALKDVIG